MIEPELKRLADDLGILTDYADARGVSQHANRDALLRMFHALGAAVEHAEDARTVRIEREEARIQAGAEPVVVAWSGVLETVRVWCTRSALAGSWQARMELEDGRVLGCEGDLGEAARVGERAHHDAVHLVLPVGLRVPLGRHRLSLAWAGRTCEVTVLAAPRRAPAGPRRAWGLFAPVYALRGETESGIGTLSELSALMRAVQARGGKFVSTLPMLAQFLDQPYDTSPFAPASRLFWNELYLDPARLHGLGACDEARALLASQERLRALQDLEAAPFVNAREQVGHVHRLLSPLARDFFAQEGERNEAYRAFLRDQPYAEEYALYRAVLDAHALRGAPTPDLRGKQLARAEADEDRRQLHLYAQWQMHDQLSALGAQARDGDVRLYLDLPVGVHSASFDVWREPDCFVHGVSVGAPPDALCPEGQNWGFAPNHPEGQRAQGYRYFTAYTRAQLRHAGMLRLDHVMGLTRIFCIPEGMSARDGLYLQQPREELYAILALEAQVHGSVLIGEDLGVVPDGVREAMQEHGMKRMFVLPFELERNEAGKATQRDVPAEALAALNTHDMPSFAGLWRAQDIDERRARGVLTAADARKERKQRKELVALLLDALGLPREATCQEALEAAVAQLGASEAELVLVALEDVWGEVEPQNVPGTFDPDRNFSRRMRHRVDRLPEAVGPLLEALSRARLLSLREAAHPRA